jgi:hypothetical protein
MKKHVVFVSIFDLTTLFYEIAQRMAAEGHEIYWITTNPAWTEWLQARGVAHERILELVYDSSDFVTPTERARLMQEIVEAERCGDVTMNQALQMDQFVMYKNKPDINEYMFLYYRDMKRFLLNNRIDHVFAEPTNSNEVVLSMLCRQIRIQFLSIRDMRIPLERIIFNEHHLQHRIVSGPSPSCHESGEAVISRFVREKSSPSYFAQNSQARAVDPKKVATSIGNRLSRVRFAKTNLTHHDLSGRIKLALTRAKNGIYMRRLCNYDRLEFVEGRVCYYGLHVQPEASIDVIGPYFSDQLKLIKDIRRALPFDLTLVVKEHPNFLGIKPISMFQEIRRLPNVALVHHDTSSFDIYQRASLVVTVSGTTAYEAGLLGIPAVVFSPMYFDGLSSVRCCPDITRLKATVEQLLSGFQRDWDADCRFMDHLMARSYPGRWGNPLTNPHLFEEENLDNLAGACLDVLRGTSEEVIRVPEGELYAELHDNR